MISFARKHETLLTVIGALIVFIGYFIKEGVRENVKDFGAKLDSAEQIHDLHNGFTKAHWDLMKVVVELRRDEVVKDIRTSDELLVFVSSGMAEMAEDSFENTQELLQKFRFYDGVATAEEQTISTDLKELRAMCDSNQKALEEHTSQELMSKRQNQLTAQYSSTMHELAVYHESVIAGARRQMEFQEKLLRIVTVLEYALFVLGWGLGLFAKFAKISSVASESE